MTEAIRSSSEVRCCHILMLLTILEIQRNRTADSHADFPAHFIHQFMGKHQGAQAGVYKTEKVKRETIRSGDIYRDDRCSSPRDKTSREIFPGRVRNPSLFETQMGNLAGWKECKKAIVSNVLDSFPDRNRVEAD